MAHKAVIRDLQLSQFLAMLSISPQVFPMSLNSDVIVRLHVSLGRPLLRLPSDGVHLAATLLILSASSVDMAKPT